MNEDRYTRNEIIADDLDDRASRSTSDIRRRINREVVRVEEERPEESIIEEAAINTEMMNNIEEGVSSDIANTQN